MLSNNSVYVPEDDLRVQFGYIDRIKNLNSDFEVNHGRRRRCCTKTYGCQQNENDTEKINGMLFSMGFEFTDDPDVADFILLNTCAVRDHAEQRVFGVIGSFVAHKRKNPDLIISVCGCMAGQEDAVNDLRTKYRQVSLVFNPHALYRFPQNLFTVMTSDGRVFDTASTKGVIAEDLPVRRTDKLRAWVSVMYGCNNFCTYCIVPYVRGRERSREPDRVLEEVRSLVADGCKDITLLGQNVNSYCGDLANGYDFSRLLKDINSIDGDFRIKFMTSHPKDASEKLFDTVALCSKVSRRIHLPFQSGSNAVLNAMNRRYTREKYIDLANYAMRVIDGLSLTSDVIVGFPGETENDFEDTLDLVRRVGFSGLYTFIYSPRPGTPAAKMDGQIPKEVSAERFGRLLELQNSLSAGYNEKYLSRNVRALVYGASADRPGFLEGRTDNDTLVQIRSDPSVKAGDIVNVHIDKALNWAIFGDVIK